MTEALITNTCGTILFNSRQPRKDVYVPIHLYGQLVKHEPGFQLLKSHSTLNKCKDTIKNLQLTTYEDIVELKAALWAIGHASTSKWGAQFLQDINITPEIIKIAEESAIFSLRG